MKKKGLLSAYLIGVGAIVGGGIFVLGGVAVAEAGSSALWVMLFNGVLAAFTARSYAELVMRFPESGGAYTYGKKILSIRTAFVVGWQLWLAHVVAALLYALGFAAYFSSTLLKLGEYFSTLNLQWFATRNGQILLASFAVMLYTLKALKSSKGEGIIENVTKLILFIGVILIGAYMFFERGGATSFGLSSVLATDGIFSAMGYTFIAFQGFELIATRAGDIDSPEKNVSKAMYLSLATAVFIYLLLLFLILTVGTPEGVDGSQWCAKRVETCVVDGVSNFLGDIGYWIMTIAALAATLSALRANLIAAAAMSSTMSRDRTLPSILCIRHKDSGAPHFALLANIIMIIILLWALPDTAAAGSAASLSFLFSFGLANVLAFVAVYRENCGSEEVEYIEPQVTALNYLPLITALACFCLGGFQLYVEPTGSLILLGWIGVGALMYYSFFSTRAEILDAYSMAVDSSLTFYRNRSPVVLVPISNPGKVTALTGFAHVLAPRDVGRILLLSVALYDEDNEANTENINKASGVVSSALKVIMRGGRERVEGIVAVNRNVWRGIRRVAQIYGCETLLMGFRGEGIGASEQQINRLFRDLDINIVILSSPNDWMVSRVKTILVPTTGRSYYDRLRAKLLGRLLSSCCIEEVKYIRVVPEDIKDSSAGRIKRLLENKAKDEIPLIGKAILERNNNVTDGILKYADSDTLILLGIGREKNGSIRIGDIAKTLAKRHRGAMAIIKGDA